METEKDPEALTTMEELSQEDLVNRRKASQIGNNRNQSACLMEMCNAHERAINPATFYEDEQASH